MPRKRLEPKSISSLKPKAGKRVVVFDTVATGLALRCTENGAKTFFFVYRIAGKPSQWLRLGTPADLSLADAREAVATYRGDVLKNIDPIAKRRDEAAAAEAARLEALRRAEAEQTFEKVARAFVDELRDAGKKSWRNYHQALIGGPLPDAKRTIKRRKKSPHVPLIEVWAGRKIGEIKRRDVRDAIDAIKKRGAKVHANRVFAYVRQVFNYALNREWIEASPCAAAELRKAILTRERRRKRNLTDVEIRGLWTALDDESPLIADVVRTLLLTGQRSGEVFGMAWSEEDSGWWTIPAERIKTSDDEDGDDHSVWLAPSARAILDTRRAKAPNRCPYVFWSNRKGGGRRATSGEPTALTTIKGATKRLNEAMGTTKKPWTPHDLRRTCKTGLAAIGVPPHIKDRVLNHVGNRSEMDEVYDQYDYRAEIRAALERWDRAVNAIVKNERVVFGSWEADVQTARDRMIAERGENLISFRARA
jgi:integrase